MASHRAAWGTYAIRAQVNIHPDFHIASVRWLGIASVGLGPITITVTWPVLFPAKETAAVGDDANGVMVPAE